VVEGYRVLGRVLRRGVDVAAHLDARGRPLAVVEQLGREGARELLEPLHARHLEAAEQQRPVPQQQLLHARPVHLSPADQVDALHARTEHQRERLGGPGEAAGLDQRVLREVQRLTADGSEHVAAHFLFALLNARAATTQPAVE
jgi:hypothetical protein